MQQPKQQINELSPQDVQQQPELLDMLLVQLSEYGLDQRYPTRFFYIQSLLEKAKDKPEPLKTSLTQKAISAVNELQRLTPKHSDTKEEKPTKALFAELIKTLNEKNLQVEQPFSDSFEDTLRLQERDLFNQKIDSSPQTAMDIYKETVAELNTEKFMEQVFNETPKGEPGPLNAHMLVIKTLSAMQQISPSYLRRIVTQIDTMFYLNSVEPAKKK